MKFGDNKHDKVCGKVAPHWGAWIEIFSVIQKEFSISGRTPLGCVD